MAVAALTKALEEAAKKIKGTKKRKPSNRRPSKKKQLVARKDTSKFTTKGLPKTMTPVRKKKSTVPSTKVKPKTQKKITDATKRGKTTLAKRKKPGLPAVTKKTAPKAKANSAKSRMTGRRKAAAAVAGMAVVGGTMIASDAAKRKKQKEQAAATNKRSYGTSTKPTTKAKPATKQTFKQAFAAANGKNFTWNGKLYHGRTKEQEAKRKTSAKKKVAPKRKAKSGDGTAYGSTYNVKKAGGRMAYAAKPSSTSKKRKSKNFKGVDLHKVARKLRNK